MGYKFEKYSIGGGGSGIIDVTEFPEVGVKGGVYRMTTEGTTELWAVMPTATMPFSDFCTLQGGSATYYLVDTLPTVMNATDMDTLIFHVYIVNDTGIGYISMDGTSASATTVGTILADGMDRGWTDDIASIDGTVEEQMGVYAYRSPDVTSYGLNNEKNTNVYGYNGSAWDELGATKDLIPRANFMDYAVLEGSADGITLSEMTTSGIACLKIHDSVTVLGDHCLSACSMSLDSIIIGSGVTRIERYALSSCVRIKSIIIPPKVVSIGAYALSECTTLENVTIPNSVTSIGEDAFFQCVALANITFGGTKAQWKAITFGTDWDISTGDYIITCTDGTIAKDGTET